MNLHPLFVHFPIALLTVYALIEVFLPFKQKMFALFRLENSLFYPLVMSPVWKDIKAFLVIFGTVLAIPTLMTGEAAEHLYLADQDPTLFFQSDLGTLIEAHSFCATASIYIFGVLAVGYILGYVGKLQKVQRVIGSTTVRILLAALGLAALLVTGALGGAISHGTEADPVVTVISNFVLSL